MTSCPPNFKSQHNLLSTLPSLTSASLLSLPPSAITKIFQTLAPDSHSQQHSDCNHAWIRPAFQFAISNSHLYHLYIQAMYSPGLDSPQHNHQEFLTIDCPLNCFTTLLSGLSSLALDWRPNTPFFDAQFVVERHIPRLETTTQTFSLENSTLDISQIENLFNISSTFPSLHTLQLSNVATRQTTHLWVPITKAWSHSLKNLAIEDTYSQFDQQCLPHFTRFQNLQRLVISSRAVQWVNPLKYLTSLNELILHNCTIYDDQVIHILSHMTHLRTLDLSETCVTPNIVNFLPPSVVRFAAGERDAHCGNEEQPAVLPGLPPIDVRQATLFEHSNPSHLNHFTRQRIIHVQPQKLPNLKFLDWGEWKDHRQGAASLRLIMPQLESLCLCGPDYDDELCDALMNSSLLRCLELYGCSVTDVTAHTLSRHTRLEFVSITNCKRITPHGLRAICTGRGACNETLESVVFFGQVQTPSEVLKDLLDSHRDMFSDADMTDENDSGSDVAVDEQIIA